jgi:hypothetical protein
VVVDTQLAQALIDQLLPPDMPGRNQWLDPLHLSGLIAKHNGNLREVFMQLYDEYESLSRTTPTAASTISYY